LIKFQENYVYKGFYNTQVQYSQPVATTRIPSSKYDYQQSKIHNFVWDTCKK